MAENQQMEKEEIDTEIRQRLTEIKGIHEVNAVLANTPTEFKVNGKVLRIAARTIKNMIAVDEKVIDLMELLQPIEDAEMVPQSELFKKVRERNRKVYEALGEVVFRIVNENTAKPEITKDWIIENVDMTDEGVANQILDSYTFYSTPVELVKKTMNLRKF